MILIPESILSGSTIEYGPYIGFPSYAHPIILDKSSVFSLNEDCKSLEYASTEYDNSSSTSFNNSVCFLTIFSTWLIVSPLIDASKIWPVPLETTLIVLEVEYPIPALIIFTPVILSLVTIALNLAPLPILVGSETIKSGVEKYSYPPNCIFVWLIDPLTIIGVIWASLPFLSEKVGFFSKFKIFDPYPVPGS